MCLSNINLLCSNTKLIMCEIRQYTVEPHYGAYNSRLESIVEECYIKTLLANDRNIWDFAFSYIEESDIKEEEQLYENNRNDLKNWYREGLDLMLDELDYLNYNYSILSKKIQVGTNTKIELFLYIMDKTKIKNV